MSPDMVLVWVLLGIAAWFAIVVLVLTLLTAAKRGDAAKEAAFMRPAGLRPHAAAPARSHGPLLTALGRLAEETHDELAVDQVMIVASDERASERAVAVAVAGMSVDVVGKSFGPRDSIAAAVALSGHALIAPDHGPLESPTHTEGDAAAVPLTVPAGAIAIACGRQARRLTADDIEQLRAILRRRDMGCELQAMPLDTYAPRGNRFLRRARRTS